MLVLTEGRILAKPSNWRGIPAANSIQMLHET